MKIINKKKLLKKYELNNTIYCRKSDFVLEK